jgi:hypothetical protein
VSSLRPPRASRLCQPRTVGRVQQLQRESARPSTPAAETEPFDSELRVHYMTWKNAESYSQRHPAPTE